jgi:hemolysin activation/secretion protein
MFGLISPSRLARGWLLVLTVGWLAPADRLWAQPLGVEPSGRSGDPPSLQREELRPLPAPTQILPPLPPPPPTGLPGPALRVFAREIRVVGSTVFTDEELARISAPYVNREVTTEDLEALRVALTRLYVDAGFVNSGAILPDQAVADGVITFQVIEGALSRIDVAGTRWFRPSYLRKRLALNADPPFNVNTLQRQIQILLEDPRLRRLNAELKPGVEPGTGILGVQVDERLPFRAWLEFNNYQSPAIGAERGLVGLEHQNVTGFGDVLTLRYGKSEGTDVQADARYALPLTAYDTTLILQYRRNDFRIVEEPFDQLEIESESEIISIGLRQPVYRSLSHHVAVELTGERLWNRTFLLGEPFSFSPGARNGESVVVAARFAAEWVYRTQSRVVAARSRFSFGVDALDATVKSGGVPDGKFFAWLGQVQFVQRVPQLWDTRVILRADMQLANDLLLPIEQVAVGGRYSVRGYRENTLVTDNAVLSSVEVRLPLVQNWRWTDYLELAPFFDFGKGWNTRGVDPEPSSLSSIGIGLRWGVPLVPAVPVRSHLEVYWGHRLRDVPRAGNTVQDHGVHLQFVVSAFF